MDTPCVEAERLFSEWPRRVQLASKAEVPCTTQRPPVIRIVVVIAVFSSDFRQNRR